MPVTRCICHDRSFDELKRLADAERLTIDQLKARTGCCTGCGMCEPYVRLMLSTGRTSFEVLSPAQAAAAMTHTNEKGRPSQDERP